MNATATYSCGDTRAWTIDNTLLLLLSRLQFLHVALDAIELLLDLVRLCRHAGRLEECCSKKLSF